jgi:regulator of sigma E protease
MSVFVAIVGLGLLVVVHEAGHFFTALGVGMRPRSFNLGFGPAIAKVTRNGVVYAFRVIPLGGYVKIPGMHRPAPPDADMYFGHALRKAPELVGPVERLKRALDIGEHDQALVELSEIETAAGQAGVEATVERGLRELRDSLGADAYWRQRTWRKVAVIIAGPGINFVLALVLFTIVLMVAGGKATRTVADVLPGHPAQALGLRGGDTIVAINHRPVTDEQIVQRISSSRGRPLTVTVIRNGRTRTLGPVRARLDEVNGERAYRLGFHLRGAHLGFGESAWESLRLSGVVTRETIKALGSAVHKEGREKFSSPVGIVRESAAQARNGWEDYLLVLGFISLSLALLNMLPLLPLDGGHIAFSIIEGIRGRAVGREVYERVSAVGLALVLLLFFVGLSNDVGRFGGG